MRFWFRRKQKPLTIERIVYYLNRVIDLCQKISAQIDGFLLRRSSLDQDFLRAYAEKIRDPVYFREIKSIEFNKLKAEHDDVSKLLVLEGELQDNLVLLGNTESELIGKPNKPGALQRWQNFIHSRATDIAAQQAELLQAIDNGIAALVAPTGIINFIRSGVAVFLMSERESDVILGKLKELTEKEDVFEWLESHRIKKWEAKLEMDVAALQEHFSREDRMLREGLRPALIKQIESFSSLVSIIGGLSRILRLQPVAVIEQRESPAMRVNLIGNLSKKQRQQLSEAGKKILGERERAMPAIPPPFASQWEVLNAYRSLANEPWVVKSFQMGGKLHNMKHIDVYIVRKIINDVLGLRLSDSNRGEYGDVYVVLTRATKTNAAKGLPSGRGILYSYGQAHMDAGGIVRKDGKYVSRRNYHHFVVEGNYVLLQRVLLSFIDNPMNLREFVHLVFGWKNEQERWFDRGSFESGSQNDLFEDMKKLITWSEETGTNEIIIPAQTEQERARAMIEPHIAPYRDINRFLEEFIDRFSSVRTGKDLQDDVYAFNWYVGSQVLDHDIYAFLNGIIIHTMNAILSRSADKFDKVLLILTSNDPREFEAHELGTDYITRRAGLPPEFIQRLRQVIEELKARCVT